MRFFYNLAFLFFGFFYLPVFLVKIRQEERPSRLLRERCGFFPRDLENKTLGQKVLWVHAVSVGEVMAVQNFIRIFLQKNPGYHILLTTVTPTGQRIAKKMEGPRLSVCYFPFDLTFAVRRFFSVLRPAALLLMETEIWPNLLTEARRRRVPVGILNARLSAGSTKKYSRFRKIFRPLFQTIRFALVQDSHDARRFSHLGVPVSRIHILGNMKFDSQLAEETEQTDGLVLRQEWGFGRKDLILMAGSTHEGEEKILAGVYEELKPRFPGLKMLVAPRHIERTGKILQIAAKKKIKAVSAGRVREEKDFEMLVLDRIGILKKLYAMADVVFVGGSLVVRGGQNPIEPSNFKKAVIHGPYVKNFEGVYRILDQQGGAILIRDPSELTFAASRLLGDQGERLKLGENAYRIVNSLRGATERHVDWVSQFLANRNEKEGKEHGSRFENVLSTFGR